MIQAMETNGGGFSAHLQSCVGGGGGDSSEEELSVLPRHTKVVVTGNNRTKSVLVGLQGVVKKAVGLGGWHWLVISNFITISIFIFIIISHFLFQSFYFICIFINSFNFKPFSCVGQFIFIYLCFILIIL
jgi:hypothetical protein